jgi:ubiquinone/menaquinone biosynthesis C-methylase UbiE
LRRPAAADALSAHGPPAIWRFADAFTTQCGGMLDGAGGDIPGQDSMNHTIEGKVSEHYARRDLETAILAALVVSGKDIERLAPDDLAPVDEFHTGGRQATAEFAEQIGVTPNEHVIDIGCGIGGPSRFFATRYGCRVTGIDLTEDYIDVAKALAQRLQLDDRVAYKHASALDLPFEAGTFDGAYMMHVGMNIEDKRALFAEARRVLKKGGWFAIFDIMRTSDGDLAYPVHWAATAQTSFVASPSEYRRGLEAAGFDVVKERDRADFARSFFARVTANLADNGEPPPLGTHLLMKRDVLEKLANVVGNLDRGLIAPTEMICTAQ